MVAIDSEPSGAAGILKLGGKSQSIVTPFTQSNIDLRDTIQGEIRLEMAGFDPASENFSIGPESAAFVKNFQLRKMASARLSVNARPWGMVTIQGLVSRREAPFHAQGVRPGSYQVEVSFPPTGHTLRKAVEVGPGASRICLAVFGEGEGISCRQGAENHAPLH